MTYQTLLNLSHIATATGIIMTALGGLGAYYYQKKLDAKNETKIKPIIDLCHKGISVTKKDDKTAHFIIPYCAGTNANAYNVKLKSAVILKEEEGFSLISDFDHDFPDGITLTYETGKSILYSLTPFTYDFSHIYICVKGNYTNEKGDTIFPVLDIYKYNKITNTWVRALGNEDESVRQFILGRLK
ncbi:MAG TPA: hypothetical protein VNQ80_08260 [Parapedobacter sp.]|uniref:hypothetical protein n=1 Tax=Parapedobacter sp. TaxID=1958893 RepID=UPI002C37B4FB|nr:hypothetical protein [Parapedobacter sp.]HWK57315.1 hypothetical protein [Parapedobacter sp.]